jgi:hypothetical protein
MALTPQNAGQQRWPLVNNDTGQLLSDNQVKHLDMIREGAKSLYVAMHMAEGSATAGDHEEEIFTTRRMQRAAEMIELAVMLARKEAVG